MPFCPTCGAEVVDTCEICPKCGTRIKKNKPITGFPSYGDVPMTPDGRRVTGEKSMPLAIIGTLIIPGFGAIYNGKVGKGILELIFFWTVVVYFYQIYDAYKLTKENNELWFAYMQSQE